jgi:hypothetical protein
MEGLPAILRVYRDYLSSHEEFAFTVSLEDCGEPWVEEIPFQGFGTDLSAFGNLFLFRQPPAEGRRLGRWFFVLTERFTDSSVMAWRANGYQLQEVLKRNGKEVPKKYADEFFPSEEEPLLPGPPPHGDTDFRFVGSSQSEDSAGIVRHGRGTGQHADSGHKEADRSTPSRAKAERATVPRKRAGRPRKDDRREEQVMRLRALGKSPQMISEETGISYKDVNNIIDRVGARERRSADKSDE